MKLTKKIFKHLLEKYYRYGLYEESKKITAQEIDDDAELYFSKPKWRKIND